MNVIMFVVGWCIGMSIGAGLVTWARLSDDHRRIEEFRAMVNMELDEIEAKVRRMEREQRRRA